MRIRQKEETDETYEKSQEEKSLGNIEIEKANNGFGPIYEKRQNRSYYATIVCWLSLVALRFTYHLCFQFLTNISEDFLVFTDVVSALLTGELIKRALLLTEEFYHVEKRYLGSTKDAVTACISFSDKNALVLVIWLTTSFVYIYKQALAMPCVSPLLYFIITITLPLCNQVLGLGTFSNAELSEISERQLKNIAKGLAWSYYFGFLQLLLPERWSSMINDAIAPDYVVDGVDMRDKLSSNKMFIVMPKDCYCYANFKDVSTYIQFEAPMPVKKISNAGIKERPYTTTLYRIQKPDEHSKFVVMEYATPLRSLYEMQQSARAQPFTSKDLNDQVIIFYKTLKEILEGDKECKNKYRLILVSAAHDDLADVILRTIEEDNNTK